jgi:hypothetical protein
MLVPSAPVVSTQPQTARLIPEPTAAVAPGSEEAVPETEIFRLSPVARAYPGQILLGLMLIGVAVGFTVRAQDFSWPPWVALAPLALGLSVLLLVWIRVKSSSYRLTNQRLFLVRVSRPMKIKELIRTQYRAARQREGVHPTEFMQSP